MNPVRVPGSPRPPAESGCFPVGRNMPGCVFTDTAGRLHPAVFLFSGGVKMIRTVCKRCLGKLEIPDRAAGREWECPKCGALLAVPGTVEIRCGGCKGRVSVKNSLSGKHIKCPMCGTSLPVPGRR